MTDDRKKEACLLDISPAESNHEGTGGRYVSDTSNIHRGVAGVKGMDVDLGAYCSQCLQFFCFHEVVRSRNLMKAWKQVRNLADRHPDTGGYAIRAVELSNEILVSSWDATNGGRFTGKKNRSLNYLQYLNLMSWVAWRHASMYCTKIIDPCPWDRHETRLTTTSSFNCISPDMQLKIKELDVQT